MDTPVPPSTSAPTPLTDDEQAAVQQLDAMLARSRAEGAPVVRANAGELKILLLLTVGLMVPMAVCYVTLPVENRRMVAAYIAVVGFVLAAWGLFRSWQARRKKSISGIAALYFMLFLMNFALYTATLVSLTHAWDMLAGDTTTIRKK